MIHPNTQKLVAASLQLSYSLLPGTHLSRGCIILARPITQILCAAVPPKPTSRQRAKLDHSRCKLGTAPPDLTRLDSTPILTYIAQPIVACARVGKTDYEKEKKGANERRTFGRPMGSVLVDYESSPLTGLLLLFQRRRVFRHIQAALSHKFRRVCAHH